MDPTTTPSLEEGLLAACHDEAGSRDTERNENEGHAKGEAKDRDEGVGARTMRKVSLRVLPLLFVFSLLSMVCKINVGYASAGMMRDLHITDEEFGTANSAFVFAYMVATIPTVLFTKKVGASRSLPLMMLGFGGATLFTAFARDLPSLLLSRLILGVTEAGVLQSQYYYLSIFYPPKQYAFAASVSVGLGMGMSDAGGGLIAALIFYFSRSSTLLAGWQWLFVVEAAPCFLVAFITYLVLPSSPSSCRRFLDDDESSWLVRATNAVQDEKRRRSFNLSRGSSLPPSSAATGGDDGVAFEERRSSVMIVRLFRDPRVILKAANVFFWGIGLWAYVFWFPQVIRYNDGGKTRSMMDVGIINVVPSSIGVVVALVAAFTSDWTGDRIFHATVGNLLQALGTALTGLNIQNRVRSTTIQLLTFSISSIGSGFYFAGSTAYEGDIFPREAAALGMAILKTIGLAGGILGPWALGYLKERSGTFIEPMYAIALMNVVAACAFFCLRFFEKG